MVACKLECAFNRLGTGVAIEESMWARHWSDRRELLCQISQRLVKEVSARDVNQLCRLLLNCGDDFGVAMACRDHRDTRGQVEKLVAVHVFYANAAAASCNQRIGTGIAGRYKATVRLDDLPGLGSRQRTHQLGSKLSVHFLFRHVLVSLADSFCGWRWSMATDSVGKSHPVHRIR